MKLSKSLFSKASDVSVSLIAFNHAVRIILILFFFFFLCRNLLDRDTFSKSDPCEYSQWKTVFSFYSLSALISDPHSFSLQSPVFRLSSNIRVILMSSSHLQRSACLRRTWMNHELKCAMAASSHLLEW